MVEERVPNGLFLKDRGWLMLQASVALNATAAGIVLEPWSPSPKRAVRVAAYKALTEAARFEAGRGAIIAMETALPRLVELVQAEGPGVSSLGLTLLKACAGLPPPSSRPPLLLL